MKRVAILILFLLLPLISAVQVEMGTSFKQGETMLVKVSGNFLTPIQDSNIVFYRGHVKIPMDYDVAKIENYYYIYANLPETNGTYKFAIENVKYMDGSQQSEEDIIKNFTITEDTAEFSIDQGFVVTNKDFSITTQNLQDEKITITSEFLDTTQSKDLFSGEIKKFNFEVDDQGTILKTLTLSSSGQTYEIPVQLVTNETKEEKKELQFRLYPEELNIDMATDSETNRILYIENTGDIDLENISLAVSDSVSSYISLSTNYIEELNVDSSVKIEIYFFSGEEENSLEGQLTAKYVNGSQINYAYSAIELNFIQNFEPEEPEEVIDPVISKTCSEMNGEICTSDETCDGATEDVNDLICCFGSCNTKPTPDNQGFSTGKIIGWLIVVVVVVFVFWFFKNKYRGASKPVDLLKIGKRK